MQQSQIVRDFLFPADQQTSCAIEPRMSAFDFPATSFSAAVLGLRKLVGLARHVRHIAAFANLAVDRPAGVAFVEAEVVRLLSRWLGTLNRDSVQRLAQQFLVRHIGAFDGNGQRHTTAVDERRTFHAQLATIRRVFPGFFPRPAALWSSPHPSSATPNQYLSVRRTRSKRVATAPQTHRIPPTPGNRRESRCQSRTAWASLSTASRWPARKKCRSPRFACPIVDVLPCDRVRRSARPDQSVPTAHREFGETSTTLDRPQAPPCRLRMVSST